MHLTKGLSNDLEVFGHSVYTVGNLSLKLYVYIYVYILGILNP